MAKVVAGMIMSLDGFVQDRAGSVAALYPDLAALDQTDLIQNEIKATGAVVMGRHAYDMAQGDFTNYEFQVPILIVTHHVPERVAKGENERLKFTFITDGIASAIQQAKGIAGEKDVMVIGGANTIEQLLQAGLVDELAVGIMPLLLGGGLRLFENIGAKPIALERIETVEIPGGGIHLRLRVMK